MKTSPCCKAQTVKRKRYGGLIVNEYCKKCKRRIWPGNKTVSRGQMGQVEKDAIRKLSLKYQKHNRKKNKFLDALAYRLDAMRDFQ